MEPMQKPSQLSEILLEKPHSVEISINSKGQYSGKVKVYASTIDEAVKQSIEKADELSKVIKEKNGTQ